MASMEIAHPEGDDGVPAAPNATETSSGDGVRSAGPSVWHKAERENARRALLQHGLERWREVRDRMYRDRDDGSTRTPAPSPSKPAGLGGSKRDVDDIAHLGFDFLRAVHATVAQRARSGARDARDARDLRTLESWARDRLRAASVGSVDRFVPDPLGVIGEWSKLERNAVPWARRLMTLDAVNLASERALAEETRDAAAATLEASLGEERCGEEKDLCANDGDADAKGVAAGKDRGKERAREMPDWWDANCDAWLLRGCGLYGAFAVTSWDDVREDAACSAAFRDAAARRGEDVRRRFLRSLEEARAQVSRMEALISSLRKQVRDLKVEQMAVEASHEVQHTIDLKGSAASNGPKSAPPLAEAAAVVGEVVGSLERHVNGAASLGLGAKRIVLDALGQHVHRLARLLAAQPHIVVAAK